MTVTTQKCPETGGLSERLLAAFPSGSYCLPALLRLLELIEDKRVSTACVDCTARPRLRVNPDFVAQYAATPERLMMLVMHELHHVILGHARLYPRSTPLDNVVFDAVINAMLCRLFPSPACTSLFTAYYREDDLLQCFLRPATGWRPDGEPPVPTALQSPERKPLARLHQALYSPTGVTYGELRTALTPAAGDAQGIEDLLLGDHRREEEDASSAGGLAARSPTLLDAVRQIVERWPRPDGAADGRALQDFLRIGQAPVRRESNRDQLVRLIRRIATTGDDSHLRRRGLAGMDVTSPVPTATDRRSIVWTTLGCRPPLYRSPAPMPCADASGRRIRVYVDVSGSVRDHLGAVYGAVLACRELVETKIGLFSTKVVDIAWDELRRGVCHTTDGTDIACVAADLRKRQTRRALLVTDGYVGRPGARDTATLKRCGLAVALTPGDSTRSDLQGLVAAWGRLNWEDFQ